METIKLKILSPAQRELEEIAAVYFELVGPISARNITNKIYDSLERICQFPRSGAMPEDKQLREAGYRFAISGDYLCIYRLVEDTIFVYHIVHGASNYPQLFKALKKQSE